MSRYSSRTRGPRAVTVVTIAVSRAPCAVDFPDGTQTIVDMGHGTYPGVMNDTRFGTQARLAMDTRRTVLETSFLITTRGAFAIDDYIADKAWHFSTAITMNDRGPILGVPQNSVTGFTGPILLTPRNGPPAPPP